MTKKTTNQMVKEFEQILCFGRPMKAETIARRVAARAKAKAAGKASLRARLQAKAEEHGADSIWAEMLAEVAS